MRIVLALLVLVAVAFVWHVRATEESPEPDPATATAGRSLASAEEETALAPLTPAGADSEAARAPASGEGEAERAGESDDQAPAAAGGDLAILLLDADLQPVPDAALEVSWWKSAGQRGDDEGHTDEAGRFATRADADWHVLSVRLATDLEGFWLNVKGPFESPPARPGEVVVRLPRIGGVSGKVTDLSGAPIAGAEVRLEAEPARSLDPYLSVLHEEGGEWTAASEDGSFRTELPEGHYRLMLRAPGALATHDVRLRLTEEKPEVELVAYMSESSRSVAGTVRFSRRPAEPEPYALLPNLWADTDELPEDLRVDFGAQVEMTPVRRVCRVTGHRTGDRFELACLDASPWTLHANLAGYESVALPIAPDVQELEVTLVPKALVRGQTVKGAVRSGAGEPLQAVVLLLSASDQRIVKITDTDSEGGFEFRFPPERADRVHALAGSEGFAWSGAGPFAISSAPDFLEITLARGRELRGRLYDERGREVAGRVQLYRPASLLPPWNGARDATLAMLLAGDEQYCEPPEPFQFDTLSDARYELLAFPDDEALPPARVFARAGEDLAIVLGTGLDALVTLHGRVFDVASDRPVAGARILASDDRHGELGMTRQAFSGRDGRFELRGLPSPVSVRVGRRGYATRSYPTLAFDAGKHRFDLELHPARTLHVRATSSAGRPLCALRITARGRDGPVQFQDSYGYAQGTAVHTDRNGRADLRGLPARDVSVLVSRLTEEDDLSAEVNYPLRAPTEAETAAEFHFDLRAPIPELVQLELSY